MIKKNWIIPLGIGVVALLTFIRPWSRNRDEIPVEKVSNDVQRKSATTENPRDAEALSKDSSLRSDELVQNPESSVQVKQQLNSENSSSAEELLPFKKEECVACVMENTKIQNVTLSEFKIVDSNLKNISITHTEMTSGSFYGSDMSGSIFENIKTVDVKLTKANLTKASFKNASLDSMFFSQATLKGSEFLQSRMENSNFYQADLSDVIIVNSQFIGCEFGEAILDKVQASGTVFDNSLFPAARITRADLRNSSFKGTNLFNVDFSGSDLSGANFFSARNFDTVKLEGAKLCGAVKPDGSLFPCKGE